MPVLSIVTYPAKVLSRPARTIKPGDVDLHDLFTQMLEAMRVHVGIGLAAPQVGKSIRFIVAEDTRTGIKRGYANPRIIQHGSDREIGPEGCLSFPGVFGRVIPNQDFRPWEGHWGAFQLAARVSYLDLDDEDISGGRQTNLALGSNWYLFPNFRIMLNYVYAHVASQGGENIVQMRLQLDL